ncbi:MAG: SDR family oxidoreductase [Planctomycetaceae bacterium]|nr:SDR family oxidoreductase [Planctomycetaceae bacterium]
MTSEQIAFPAQIKSDLPSDGDDRSYHFLTGGTGLLGGYLLRDLLAQGLRLAVLVRPAKKESVQQRVETILVRHERKTGLVLPRPVVVEGDLTEGTWRQHWTDWLSRHCRSVIHCGASLTFYGDKNSEPWMTNIEGTRQVLELCRTAGIRSLHHFSTAYIAGSYRDKFHEEMLDVGQELRNDYERSKFESEKMVREADFIDQLTVYRPSIVVGDSVTYETTTYHGYYAVLKLAHTLVNRLRLGDTSGRRLLAALGMTGEEYKNFVPVDWVSAVFTQIFTHPENHGKTYHLTNPSPTSILEMVDTIQQLVEQHSELAGETDSFRMSEEWFKENYAASVATYKDYLNNDPLFLCDNVLAAAPNLICPKVDTKMMYDMGQFAIRNNFGKRSPKSGKSDVDVGYVDVGRLVRQVAKGVTKVNGNLCGTRRIALRASGPGGGEWTFFVGQDGYFYEDGIGNDCHDHIELSVVELISLIQGNAKLTRRFSPEVAHLLDTFSM